MKNLTLLLTIALVACTAKQPPSTGTKPETTQLTLMTFNVENLFDTQDDKRKNDDTFLPRSAKKSSKHRGKCQRIKVNKWRNQCLHWDWNEKALQTKLERIAQVIQTVEQGQGPDVIFFQEVENKAVLERLRKTYLGEMKYQESILIEGSDTRGIDVAIMSKFPIVGQAKILPIKFARNTERRRISDTRGILAAKIKVNDQNISLFSVHFPAPFHPKEMRQDAFRALNKYLKDQGEQMTIAAGDFNLTSSEDRKEKTLQNIVQPLWKVSHLEGCKRCKGTNYYRRHKNWSFLDMILISRKGLDATAWSLDPSSVFIANDLGFQSRKGTPYAFKMPGMKGLSDHWPVVMTLKWANK